ncbi:MAG: hypothetical protein FGM43_06990 [Sinobacteraceae bacterium]|nr:hypothetical protein [Nevskiaceae bacterium]
MGDLIVRLIWILAIAAQPLAAQSDPPTNAEPPANAPQDSRLVTDARRCGALSDIGQRLACYDRLFRTEQLGTASKVDVPKTDEALFGYRGKIAQEARDEQAKALASNLAELSASVEAVDYLANGTFRVSLDNGQHWQQLASGVTLRLKTGESIVIKPGALGSFTLVAASGRAAKVKRVR